MQAILSFLSAGSAPNEDGRQSNGAVRTASAAFELRTTKVRRGIFPKSMACSFRYVAVLGVG